MDLSVTTSRPTTCFLGPLVSEKDKVQIPYEIYEIGNYSLAIKTDKELNNGQSVVLQNKVGMKKFLVEPIKKSEGRYKLYSDNSESNDLLVSLMSEKVKAQTPRFDVPVETEVFVKTFGSKQVFLLNLTNLSATGFRMDTGNITHKIPFRENTLLEVRVPKQEGVGSEFTLLAKVVWVSDDRKSKLKNGFGVTLVDFEESDIANWKSIVKKHEESEFQDKSSSLKLVA